MRLIARTWFSDRLLLGAMPAALMAGAWLIGQVTVDHLLHHDAVMTGQGWATYLAENVADLDQIIAGQKPSAESRRFFERAQRVGQVFRYVVYDQDGNVRLASNDAGDDDDDDKDADARNLSAVRAITTGQPVVNAEAAEAAEASRRPPFFAEAYVPVSVRGRPIGVVETYVDQTEKRNAYRHTLVLTSAALVGLISLAFGVPALAWYRRRRDKQRAEARVHFLAHHDALTGLINREQLTVAATRLLAGHGGQQGRLALHYIDIDHFKDINDTLGHGVGDTLIRSVADRLQAMAGPNDCVARVGGDEFIILQADWASDIGASAYAAEVVRAMADPFDVDGHAIAITTSVGTAVAPAHGDTLTRLMKSADLALYRSKSNGRNGMVLFSTDMDQELEARLHMERALRHAVANDGFELHFQPAVEMPARRLVGFEALVRMHDGTGRLISPAAFIPLAEKMGLIDGIGTWVLREACRTAATWPPHLTVAVNLSPLQLSTGRLAQTVVAALEESGLDPRQLELEVTEGMLLDNSASVMSQLRAIKALNVGIVMDDFGTGYSSLSYLWKFPFDKIKIDRAFMLALDQQANDEASTIVKTIIDLGRSLNVTVTVEGVENESQVAFVDQARCDQIQGYYFGRPMPAIDLAAHIARALHEDTIAQSDLAPPAEGRLIFA